MNSQNGLNKLSSSLHPLFQEDALFFKRMKATGSPIICLMKQSWYFKGSKPLKGGGGTIFMIRLTF